MQHGVVTLAADCTPFRLDAGFVRLPLAVCSLALGGFVVSSIIEAEATALCLGNDGGPFLWCLRPEHVADEESGLEPGFSLGILRSMVV